MPHPWLSFRLLPLLLSTMTARCVCDVDPLQQQQAWLRVTPQQIDFGVVQLDAPTFTRSARLRVEGLVDVDVVDVEVVTHDTAQPAGGAVFVDDLASPLRVYADSPTKIAITMDAAYLGIIDRTLVITEASGRRHEVQLRGAVVDVASCDDDDACTTDSMNPDGTCAHRSLDEGASCGAHVPCDAMQVCLSGTCERVELSSVGDCGAGVCDDANACTIDVTAADGSCLNVGDPTLCASNNPCRDSRCLPDGGCASDPVADGTPCGARVACEMADVCVDGACTTTDLSDDPGCIVTDPPVTDPPVIDVPVWPADLAGCADGTREGFVDVGTSPDVAGCSGAWRIAGIGYFTGPRQPQCNRQGGNHGAMPSGTQCGVEDLCAEGWHVCETVADVADSAHGLGCTGATRPGDPLLFFATRVSGPGCARCAVEPEAMLDRNFNCGVVGEIENDLFGCGNQGQGTHTECAPLNRFSNNGCYALDDAWVCDGSSLREAANVVKTTSSGGGVMCCRDAEQLADGSD